MRRRTEERPRTHTLAGQNDHHDAQRVFGVFGVFGVFHRPGQIRSCPCAEGVPRMCRGCAEDVLRMFTPGCSRRCPPPPPPAGRGGPHDSRNKKNRQTPKIPRRCLFVYHSIDSICCRWHYSEAARATRSYVPRVHLPRFAHSPFPACRPRSPPTEYASPIEPPDAPRTTVGRTEKRRNLQRTPGSV
jgi:hypothetical protein